MTGALEPLELKVKEMFMMVMVVIIMMVMLVIIMMVMVIIIMMVVVLIIMMMMVVIMTIMRMNMTCAVDPLELMVISKSYQHHYWHKMLAIVSLEPFELKVNKFHFILSLIEIGWNKGKQV